MSSKDETGSMDMTFGPNVLVFPARSKSSMTNSSVDLRPFCSTLNPVSGRSRIAMSDVDPYLKQRVTGFIARAQSQAQEREQGWFEAIRKLESLLEEMVRMKGVERVEDVIDRQMELVVASVNG